MLVCSLSAGVVLGCRPSIVTVQAPCPLPGYIWLHLLPVRARTPAGTLNWSEGVLGCSVRDITGADPWIKTMRGAILRIGLKLKHFRGRVCYINRKLSDSVMSLVRTTPILLCKHTLTCTCVCTYTHTTTHTQPHAHTHTHTTTHKDNHTHFQAQSFFLGWHFQQEADSIM